MAKWRTAVVLAPAPKDLMTNTNRMPTTAGWVAELAAAPEATEEHYPIVADFFARLIADNLVTKAAALFRSHYVQAQLDEGPDNPAYTPSSNGAANYSESMEALRVEVPVDLTRIGDDDYRLAILDRIHELAKNYLHGMKNV